MEYHRRAEYYDQQVCSRKDDTGIAVPANARESSLINTHARQLVLELVRRERLDRLGELELRKYIQQTSREFIREFLRTRS